MADAESTARVRDRPPSLLACITCRKKHLRCDAQMPVCGRCQTRKLPCVYLESKRGYRPRKSQNQIDGAGPEGETLMQKEETTRDNVRNGSLFTANSWPLALQDGANESSPVISASPVESIPRNALFDRENQPRQLHHSEDLVDIFYTCFFPAQGFVVPRKLLLQYPRIIPEELRAVFRYIGSHFQHIQLQERLREEAFRIADDDVQIDPGFKIQGLLCLAMVCMAGRLERNLGVRFLHEAIDLTLSVGFHRNTYATRRPEDHPILAESWRRTYWDLYVVDTLLSALDGSNYTSRLEDMNTDLPLPGHSDDYINCRLKPAAPTMQEMADRVFAETPYNYSSGAYKVEAARIMRKVLALEEDSFNSTNSQVEAVDASVQSFLLSLPPRFREVLESDGKVDEVLFAAHMIIQWASILLHRPRSNLTFIRNHYSTACSTEESIGIPALSFQSHTAKAIRAANAISKLTAIQTPPTLHTPCFACAIALSATVHLPAYKMQENNSEIKERLHLSVSALAAIGEVWPLAITVRAQLAQFARETFKAANFQDINATADVSGIEEGHRMEEYDLQDLVNDDSWLNDLDVFAAIPLPRGGQSSWS